MIEASLSLQTASLEPCDFDRGIVRLDPSELKRLGISVGSRIALKAGRTIYATAQPAKMEHRNQSLVLLDDLQIHNCGAKLGSTLVIAPAPSLHHLSHITVSTQHLLDSRAAQARLATIYSQMEGQIFNNGDIVRIRMADQYDLMLQVTATDHNAAGIVRGMTSITITTAPNTKIPPAMLKLGGLRREFYWLEEWVHAVQHTPQNTQRGLILEGPAGSGKTQLIEALSQYTGLYLDKINAARIVANAQTAHNVFERSFAAASSQAPALIIIDDIDVLLPATNNWEQIMLANQLYTQIDQLPQQMPIAIIGISHQRNALDPAAMRPGRFDHRLVIDAPDKDNRMEILQIQTHDYSLDQDVKLDRLANQTQGFIGSDLLAMTKQASLRAQRTETIKARAIGAKAQPQPIAMRHFLSALTEIIPHGQTDFLTETSTVSWQDIAGFEDIKQTLREAVERPINYGLLHDNKEAPAPHGILITGAPGTGKTSIVRALAGATRARFIHVDSYDIALADHPARSLRQIFDKARLSSPSMLFFDNIEALIPTTDATQDKTAFIFNAFLREFDATQELLGLTILAATNHADRIDQTLLRPGRFDYVINIPLPDKLARQKIFDYHAHKLPLASDVNCEELAENSNGFSGADIDGVCRRAGLLALRQSVAQQEGLLAPPVVTMAIFSQILRGWRR